MIARNLTFTQFNSHQTFDINMFRIILPTIIFFDVHGYAKDFYYTRYQTFCIYMGHWVLGYQYTYIRDSMSILYVKKEDMYNFFDFLKLVSRLYLTSLTSSTEIARLDSPDGELGKEIPYRVIQKSQYGRITRIIQVLT